MRTPVITRLAARWSCRGLSPAVADQIEQILGRPVQVERAPERAGDVRHSQAARDVVDALFPDVRVVSLAEGLRAAVDWYAARRASSGPG